jgi:hypothetical protein
VSALIDWERTARHQNVLLDLRRGLIDRLVEALTRIADTDYRGNRALVAEGFRFDNPNRKESL